MKRFVRFEKVWYGCLLRFDKIWSILDMICKGLVRIWKDVGRIWFEMVRLGKVPFLFD